jgi:GABA(A) receptor-associated protein
MQGVFKNETPFEKRYELCSRIRTQYPDRIPIIVEVARSNNQLKLNRKKFLAPSDISVGGFLGEIRKQACLRPEEAIFIFCGSGGGVLVPTGDNMADIYEKYKDDDGFLYIIVALENTFGALQTIDMLTFGVLDGMLRSSSRAARTLGLGKLL